MRRSVFLLALLGALTLPGAASASTPANGDALWSCGYQSTLADDPIVFPGMPGVTHLHDFAGAAGTNAYTTFPSLRAASTSCTVKGDHSAYWAPTLIAVDGITQVRYSGVAVYWRGIGRTTPISPFPDGMQHVQGNSHNTDPNAYSATWRCHTPTGTTAVFIPRTCNGAGVEESIYFPYCSNGQPTGPSHHALGPCGAAYPVNVPGIQLVVEYPPAAAGGALSSDYSVPGGLTRPGLTGHADYFNAIPAAVQQRIITTCLDTPAVKCRVDAQGNMVNFASPLSPKPIVLTAAQLSG